MAIDGEFEDEGEAAAGGANGPQLGIRSEIYRAVSGATPFSVRGRIKRAWQILRNKDVEQLTADPEGALRHARAHQENRWRGVYALVLLVGMTGQIAFADVIFLQFLIANDFEVDSAIFIAFFASVVVEVIGLVLVVTRSLFPNTDGLSVRSVPPSTTGAFPAVVD